MIRRSFLLAVYASLLLVTSIASAADEKPLEFRVKFDPSVSPKPFTGRVYVMLSTSARKEPPNGISWFGPQPVFALDVRDWKPGDTITVGKNALAYPKKLHELTPGKYGVYAIMDFNQGYTSFSSAPGNGYSEGAYYDLDPAKSGPITLVINRVLPPREYKDTERVKYVDIPSKLLTAFYGRPTTLRAGVALPKSFATHPKQRYPVVYEIPGFGGTHTGAGFATNKTDVAGVEMLWVVLDPSCWSGHHVFADSANNGPCGRALLEELIPHIEKQFRGLGVPTARFVTGHSSGGWSSLWLQVAYPDFFGGVWSTAPDPVDFTDFQQINIYQPGANVFTDENGKPRPLARSRGKAIQFYKPFSDMEVVMGHGGQLGSFEAVFSPRGPDGKPRPLWDRVTGKVDPETAKAWEQYDIRLVIERNWNTLGPKLAGKLHVYMGSEDTFYLEGAVIKLKDVMAKLDSDAVIEIFPGKDHGTLMTPELRQRIAKEMAAQFRKHHAANREDAP